MPAGELIEDVCSQVDVNMGCPEHFSIQGGMGASLIWEPDRAGSILSGLIKSLKIPVSCKIRIRPDLGETVDFAKQMASLGIKYLSLHPRTKQEKSVGPAHWIVGKTLKATEGFSVPLNMSGDCFSV